MPKKIDIGGETFIVSEDVDLDKLDTENMVQKKEPEEKKFSIEIKDDPRNSSKDDIKKDRLPAKISFRYLEKTYDFNCSVFFLDFSKDKLKYKLLMKTVDALVLHGLFVERVNSYIKNTDIYCQGLEFNEVLEPRKSRSFVVRKVKVLPGNNTKNSTVQIVLVSKLL